MKNNLEAAVDLITYKSNFIIKCYRELDSDSFSVRIHMNVSNVLEPAKIVPIMSCGIYPGETINDLSVIGWVNVVRDLLKNLESHEFDEWFKVDGKCFTDPHPEMPYKE